MHGMFALAAGVIKELYKNVDKKYSIKRLIVGGLTSSFAGILAFMLCASFNIPAYIVSAIVGISGWMGGEFMDFGSKLVKKFIISKLIINGNGDK
jgi:hypothetical protein